MRWWLVETRGGERYGGGGCGEGERRTCWWGEKDVVVRD